MIVIGCGKESFLYLNGIATDKVIQLHDDVVLYPVSTTFQYEKVSDLLENDIDFAVAAVSGRTIASQIRIAASDGEQMARIAWNTEWDCILLGAIFCCEVMGNVQCDKPVEQLAQATYIHVTNYAFRAMFSPPYQLSNDDVEWIKRYYLKAHNLLKHDGFVTAVHAMASYKWHSMPRVQLAVLWSGIEALFETSTEISFRISLYIANFLAGENPEKAKEIFTLTRSLYSARSKAVHGGKIKGEINDLVFQSAQLLNRIIKRCAEQGGLPETDNLVFPSAFLYQC